MSRSRWKSHTPFGRFDNFVCYFSNKKSRTAANQCFRTKNKHYLQALKTILITYVENPDEDFYNDIERAETKLMKKLRECSDTWDFASDGLKQYRGRKDWWREIDDEEWNSYARK